MAAGGMGGLFSMLGSSGAGSSMMKSGGGADMSSNKSMGQSRAPTAINNFFASLEDAARRKAADRQNIAGMLTEPFSGEASGTGAELFKGGSGGRLTSRERASLSKAEEAKARRSFATSGKSEKATEQKKGGLDFASLISSISSLSGKGGGGEAAEGIKDG